MHSHNFDSHTMGQKQRGENKRRRNTHILHNADVTRMIKLVHTYIGVYGLADTFELHRKLGSRASGGSITPAAASCEQDCRYTTRSHGVGGRSPRGRWCSPRGAH